MKSLSRILVLAAAGTLACTSLHAAQARPATVTAGTFTLTLNSDLVEGLKNFGITTSYIGNEVSSKTSPEFQVQGGVIDLQNATGEIQSNGGIRFTDGRYSLILQRLALSNSSAGGAQLTALVTVDGVSMGRSPVFTITGAPMVTLPLHFGQQSSGPLSFKVNPALITLLNNFFGAQMRASDYMLGQFDLNLLLAPQE